MGYALLWIEGLAAGLLLVAVATGCAARLESRRWQRAWAAGVLLLVVLPAAALSAVLWWFAAKYPLHTWLFFYVLSWTVFCGLLGVLVIVRGLRPAEASAQIGADPRARSWRRGQFVTWLIIVLVVQTHTFFIIDMRVRSALKAVREKALEVARSLEQVAVPDEQNAAGRYAAAAKTLGDYDNFAGQFGSYEVIEFDAKQPGLAPALQKRQAALADVREASTLPACYENRSLVHGTRIEFQGSNNLIDLMNVANFLAMDARVKAAAGDVAGALDDLAAIKRIAAHVSRDPTLVSQMIARAIDAIAAEVSEPVLAAAAPLPPELISLPVAVHGLERDNWVRTWQFEMTVIQWVMTQDSISSREHYNRPWKLHEVVNETWWRVFLMQREMAETLKQYEQFISIARQPYHLVRETLAHNKQRGRGIMTSIIVPNLREVFKTFSAAQAVARLHALTLAAAAFNGRTGRYPQSAAELVPAYIVEIPTDPFSGKPLRLKPVPGGLILYSVGDDAEDNGGKRGLKFGWGEDGEDIVFRLGAAYKK